MSALAKQHRFCSSDFIRLHKVKKYSGKIINIRYTEGSTKAGFQVKKKIFKLAVDRNYIKRILKECFRAGLLKGFQGSVLISIKRHVAREELAKTLGGDWNDFMRKLKYV